MSELKRTQLYEIHVAAGASMVDFGGWEMPVQYPTGIVAEHLYTRHFCSLFDVSHMGRLLIEGPERLAFLQHVLSSNVAGLDLNMAQYCILPDEDGGAVDDAYLYRFEEERLLLVVNAANTEKDLIHLRSVVKDYDCTITDITSQWASIAVQGPKSKDLLTTLSGGVQVTEPMKNALNTLTFEGHEVKVAKTGYTGDAGRTLVTCAERGGMRMIAVTLHDGSDWADHAALYDYGFSAYALSSGAKKGEAYGSVSVDGQSVSAVAAESFRYPTAENEALSVRAELPQTVSTPVRKGQTFGTLVISCGETEVGRVDLVSARSVQAQEPKSETSKNKSLAEKLWQFLSAK